MTTKKLAAHDRWVCLGCRWSAKFPLVDARVPDRPKYDCPKCNKHMLWAGTAFRPPRQEDDEAWQVAERILRAGYRFRTTSRRQRFPKTLNEVDQWLESQRTGPAWLAERKLSVEKTPGGKLKVRSGKRTLVDDEPILILHDGTWIEGRMKLHGDGRKPLASPFVTLSSTRRNVPLTVRTRARIQSR